MSMALINERLMQSVQVGLAIVEPRTCTTLFSNNHFNSWFGVNEGLPLGVFIDIQQVSEILSDPPEVLPGKIDIVVKPKRREYALSIHFSHFEVQDKQYVFVEVHNQTRNKELEAMINSYAKMMERNEREIKREKERAEKLLLNIMPKSVLAELKQFGVTTPTRYDSASVIMIDFVSSTEMKISEDPTAVVTELNDIFTNFDRIMEQFGCERIKTMGDAYMAVSGVPEPDPDHAANIAKAALLVKRYLNRRNQTHHESWIARIGIASGPVIGSIVGIHKYVYDIFGPAVNMAARMERRAGAMEIAVCSPLKEMLDQDFALIAKATEDIKGFGKTRIYTLDKIIRGNMDAY
ncbi:adenylate/guanylate cyclase domain-containing protein [Gammaproteobacteria bacterium]|nr:adenylate/guanylate cyclase domain-containing protein [Gammaproteobacteria bacterium]